MDLGEINPALLEDTALDDHTGLPAPAAWTRPNILLKRAAVEALEPGGDAILEVAHRLGASTSLQIV
jgi:hypothetical protein